MVHAAFYGAQHFGLSMRPRMRRGRVFWSDKYEDFIALAAAFGVPVISATFTTNERDWEDMHVS